MEWDKETKQKAIDLANDGVSAALIALELGRNCTRNAVLGMLFREKENGVEIKSKQKPVVSKVRTAPRAPRPKADKFAKLGRISQSVFDRPYIGEPPKPGEHALPVDDLETLLANAAKHRKRWMDSSGRRECRFIYTIDVLAVSFDQVEVCAAPCDIEETYCPAHRRLCLTKPDPEKRKGVRSGGVHDRRQFDLNMSKRGHAHA